MIRATLLVLVCGSPVHSWPHSAGLPAGAVLECKWLWLGGYPLAGEQRLLTSAWNRVFPAHTPASLIVSLAEWPGMGKFH